MNNAAKKRIFLIDDHPLLRQGIAQLVNEQPDLEICGEAEEGAGALKGVEATRPDLAVVDLSLRDQSGLELVKNLKAVFPAIRVLVLSMHDESLYAERALRAGAQGYIMKREASLKVLEAIRHILGGGIYASDRIVASILNKVTGGPTDSTPLGVNVLTDRELEVLTLIGKGWGAKQIARRLNISIKTVEAHRAHIKSKLDLGSGHDLLQFAIRWDRTQGDS
jgi:DNA-binding NarL/FixJ family response regulator